MSDELTPITRKETFLAKAGGQNVVTPTPITREETFLQAIIDNGSGGGGGGGGALYVSVTTNDGITYETSKTYSEIASAYADGKAIIIIDEVDYYGCALAYNVDGSGAPFSAVALTFFTTEGGSANLVGWTFTITSSNAVDFNYADFS